MTGVGDARAGRVSLVLGWCEKYCVGDKALRGGCDQCPRSWGAGGRPVVCLMAVP